MEKLQLNEQQEEMEAECNTLETEEENASLSDSLELQRQAGSDQSLDKHVAKNSNPSKTKEASAGTKVKRKSRSTRRKLNAMVSNASLHFSDTDSEGELITINSQIKPSSHVSIDQQRPIISVTSDDVDIENEHENSNCVSSEDKGNSHRNFVENLTDVDEIYASEPENEQREDESNLKIAESPCQGETDLEDFDCDDEVQSMIYLKARSDIFCDYSGETISTKEGDGPFSVEVRNKMYLQEIPKQNACSTPDIVVESNTDEEDIDMSDEEDLEEACCSQKELFEDLDILAASQIVMKNINKVENMLTVKETSDDAISDCHTDIEDVDQIE